MNTAPLFAVLSSPSSSYPGADTATILRSLLAVIDEPNLSPSLLFGIDKIW